MGRIARLCRCVLLFSILILASAGHAAPPPLSASGDALFAQNRFEQARQAYAAQVKNHPGDPALSVGLLRSLLRLDHWQEALTFGQSAVNQQPDNADLHGLLALAWMRAGQPDQSDVEAQQSLHRNPSGYWGLIAAARVDAWNGHPKSADARLTLAIQVQPDEPEAWLQRFLLVGDTAKTKHDALIEAAELLKSKPLLTAKGHPFENLAEAARESHSFFAAEQRYFVTDLPFQAIAPLSETRLKDFDRGDGTFSITVPVQRLEGTVLVPVIIDDHPLKLLFDTGGQEVITLNASVAKRLHLSPLSSLTIQGVTGKETTSLIKASRLTLGASSGLIFRSIPLHVLSRDQKHVDGTFGGGILHQYRVTLDLKNNRMTLTRGRPLSPPATSLAVPLHEYRGELFLPLRSGGISFWAFLDTGASFDIASLRLAQKLAVGIPVSQLTRGSTAGLTSFGVTTHKISYLSLDQPVPFAFVDQNAAFEEPAVTGLSALDDQISPAQDFEQSLILGMPFLSHYQEVTIDYPKRILYLTPDDGTAGSTAPGETSSMISTDKALELTVNGKVYAVIVPPDSRVTVHPDGKVTLDSPDGKSEILSTNS